MAQLRKQNVVIEAQVTLTLSEVELRALDALAGYGIDAFFKVFYEHLGQHYLKPHAEGLRTLFEAVRGCASLASDAEECRKFMQQANGERMKAMLAGKPTNG